MKRQGAERPQPSPLLDPASRRAWRAWLKAHAASAKEVWLVFWKKHTGKAALSYNDAVEEALCFGWIDSTARRLDDDRYAQRFSPRRPRTPYSQANKERLRIRVGFIEGARTRPAEFAKRLRHFVRMTAQDRRYGYGGIEKHYDRA